ncbi:MAG: glycosyltransferase [Fibrobacterota bacterium]
MIWAGAVLSLIYLLQCFWLSRGLYRHHDKDVTAPAGPLPDVDILIAARNEEHTLPLLLTSLLRQSQPPHSITVINDRSTDNTAAVVESYGESHPHIRCITVTELPRGVAPKKNALQIGVAEATADIIAVTDADCIAPPDWVKRLSEAFTDSRTGMVQGITVYHSDSSLSPGLRIFQHIDFLSHGIIAAAAIEQNLPINSNANNFAYRRSIFKDLAGYGTQAGIISGDDDLLLQRVWKSNVWKIRFLFDPSAKIRTTPGTTWRELLNQRVRWGSKTVHYTLPQRLFLSLIFIFYTMTLLSLPAVVLGAVPPFIPALLFAVKIAGEALLLIPGSRLFREPVPPATLLWVSPLQLAVVFYAVLRGVFGTFTWKEQSFSRKTSS